MPSYKKSINELAHLQSENDNAIQNQLERLGGQIAELDENVLRDTEYAVAANRIKAIEELIRQKAHTIETWNEQSDELDTIDDAIRQIEAEIGGKARELEPHLETIGEAALDAYLADPDKYDIVADAVAQLVTIEEVIRSKERELKTLETTDQPDSFIGKTVARGRGLVLRGSLRSRGARRSRALRGAGEYICNMESIEDFDDESAFSKALIPVKAFLEERRKLRHEREQLERNRDEVQQSRLETEKRERMRNPVKNLGHEIEKLRAQAAELAIELGAGCMGSASSDAKLAPEIKTSIEFIEQLQNENTKAAKLTDRLIAALDVDRLSGDIEAKKAQRASLEAEIEALDASVERMKTDKAARTKARGSAASLDDDLDAILNKQEE